MSLKNLPTVASVSRSFFSLDFCFFECFIISSFLFSVPALKCFIVQPRHQMPRWISFPSMLAGLLSRCHKNAESVDVHDMSSACFLCYLYSFFQWLSASICLLDCFKITFLVYGYNYAIYCMRLEWFECAMYHTFVDVAASHPTRDPRSGADMDVKASIRMEGPIHLHAGKYQTCDTYQKQITFHETDFPNRFLPDTKNDKTAL